ncbi:replication-relaxation family protein [Lysinibacillus sp. NPDC097214]|uniref:replication-relaxation family protein n=1 Tax=Lysinibacillus sp. NPDC097214 TaxID=3390584 RepID=UPI003D003292
MSYVFIEGKSEEVYLTSTIPNRIAGVCLDQEEMKILQVIYSHRMMPASCIHELYRVHRSNMSKSSVSNRLKRLVTMKVLQRKESTRTRDTYFKVYYYGVTERAFKALRVAGYISDKTFPGNKEMRIPNDHNLAAIYSMVDLYVENELENPKCEFEILRGSKHPLIQRKDFKNLLVPDYIVELDNLMICIEVDMGTEVISTITNKSKKYVRIAEQEAFQEKKLIVVYLVVYGEDRRSTRRVQNIKTAHLSIADEIVDLPMYVVGVDQFYLLMQLLLQGKYPLNNGLKEQVIMDASLLLRLQYHQSKGWRYRIPSKEQLLLEKRDISKLEEVPLQASTFYEPRGVFKTVSFVIGELANIQSFIQMQLCTQLFGKTNEAIFMNEVYPIEMVVTYPHISNDVLSSEVASIQPVIDVYLQTHEEVLFSMNQNSSERHLQSNRLSVESPLKLSWKGVVG